HKELHSIPTRRSSDLKMNVAEIYFDKKEEKEYKLLLEPGAITDFFGRENDSLQVGIRTRSFSDYGSLRLTLENVNQEKMPIIVQDRKSTRLNSSHVKN